MAAVQPWTRTLDTVCGRIALYSDTPHLARLLGAGFDPDLLDEVPPRWNIGPTSPILGVRASRQGSRTLDVYRWGLVPGWSKDPAMVRGTFNARAESVATKPMFSSAFSRWRTLIPVDAFYEWEEISPKSKQPYAFKRADGEPVVFAGLRDHWKGVDGSELRSAAIITTSAGPDMPIHDRQPVVLEREVWDHWLDPDVTDRDELEPLLTAGDEGTLVHYPVGQEVGDIRNDDPGLIEARSPQADPGQISLWAGEEPSDRSTATHRPPR